MQSIPKIHLCVQSAYQHIEIRILSHNCNVYEILFCIYTCIQHDLLYLFLTLLQTLLDDASYLDSFSWQWSACWSKMALVIWLDDPCQEAENIAAFLGLPNLLPVFGTSHHGICLAVLGIGGCCITVVPILPVRTYSEGDARKRGQFWHYSHWHVGYLGGVYRVPCII